MIIQVLPIEPKQSVSIISHLIVEVLEVGQLSEQSKVVSHQHNTGVAEQSDLPCSHIF